MSLEKSHLSQKDTCAVKEIKKHNKDFLFTVMKLQLLLW